MTGRGSLCKRAGSREAGKQASRLPVCKMTRRPPLLIRRDGGFEVCRVQWARLERVSDQGVVG